MAVDVGTARLGLVGCEGVTGSYLDAIARVPRLCIASVQDADTAAAVSLARRVHAATVADPAAILSDPAIDAVIVRASLASDAYPELIRRTLEAGKHVLCEKLFMTSSEEACEIGRLAEKRARTLMIASKVRSVPDVVEARRLLRIGAIGEALIAEVTFCGADDRARLGNLGSVSADGVMIDSGPLAADLIRYLVGPIRSVYAQAGKRVRPMKAEDTVRLHFETDDHVVGMADLSLSFRKPSPCYARLIGTKGAIDLGWERSSVWDAATGTSCAFGQAYDETVAFEGMLERFAVCLLEGSEPALGIAEAIESIRVIETARVSLRERQWLRVPA